MNSMRIHLISNRICFNRCFNLCDNNLNIITKYQINYCFKNVLNVRHFCEKNDMNLNKLVKEVKHKSIEKQIGNKENLTEITAKRIGKRREYFHIIVKKPNQLMEWLAKTPREKKKNILFSAIIKYMIKPLGILSLFALAYILAHSDINPITERRCVYSVPQKLADQIEKDILNEIFAKNMKSGSFLPSTHPVVKRLDNCFDKLIESNNDLEFFENGIWSPIVINDENFTDVIVLKESQNVFVSKKVLDLCQTDDELAYILAHQLSHVLLDHNREPIAHASNIFLLPFLAILPQIWIFQTDDLFRFDPFQKIDDYLDKSIKSLIRKTLEFSSFNEELEEEADRIALQLMTRSCFDVRKCHQFCKRCKDFARNPIEAKEKDNKSEDNYDFFVKHPITEYKILYLFKYIKPFVDLRKICNCEPLL